MKGINFIVDDSGRKTAVVISLEAYGELWEGFYDSLLARDRESEPRESLEAVTRRLSGQGKLNVDE